MLCKSEPTLCAETKILTLFVVTISFFPAFREGDAKAAAASFAKLGEIVTINAPVYGDGIVYDKEKRSAIMVSKLGASNAINLGAYTFALAQIDA